jgi:integrase
MNKGISLFTERYQDDTLKKDITALRVKGGDSMKAEKDPKTGKWLIQYRYTDWQGNRKKSTKRGFATKRDAEEWLRKFLLMQSSNFDMSFEDFLKIYYEDMNVRLRENTMRTKKYIIDLKILPYFKNLSMNSIKPADIRKWENQLLSQGYSLTYIKTIYNQLNAIFNYAVRYHDLKGNPCAKAGSIGKNKADEMKFWTKEQFNQFIEGVMDKHISYVISIPEFLAADLQDYMNSLYDVGKKDRLFPITKYYIKNEIARGCKKTGVPIIRAHDLRHSHCSLLIELKFQPLEIAERLGHERVETTLNTYSHLYPNKQRILSDRLEEEYRRDFDGEED